MNFMNTVIYIVIDLPA